MKKILVTGGSGFVGRQVVRFLEERGFTVLAPSSAELNVLDAAAVTTYLKEHAPSYVLHCAWIATPGVYQESPENEQWVIASMHLFREAIEHGATRIVGVGSCFEYSDYSKPCVEDETSTDNATTFYGRSKDQCRRLLMDLAAEKGISAAWGRIFFLYGPGEPQKKLIASVITSLLSGNDVDCTHGMQVRDFSYVEDVGEGFAALVDSTVIGPVNIASGEAITMKELILTAAWELQGENKVHFGAREAPVNEPPMIAADISKLLSTGWTRRHSHEEGIKRTVAWWKGAPPASSAPGA